MQIYTTYFFNEDCSVNHPSIHVALLLLYQRNSEVALITDFINFVLDPTWGK